MTWPFFLLEQCNIESVIGAWTTRDSGYMEKRMTMEKELWKPGNMLYPLPVVMVSVTDGEGHDNIITVAWAGTVCSDPPMLSISVRPERHSYSMLKKTGEFVVNLVTEELVYATDFCGVRSGRDLDKFKEMKLTKLPADQVKVPLIGESPVNLECKVSQVIPLGTHDMFLARVVAVHADRRYMDQQGKFHLEQAGPVVYSHGDYLATGKRLGTFGYSVRKKRGRGGVHETSPHYNVLAVFAAEIVQGFVQALLLFSVRSRLRSSPDRVFGGGRLVVEQAQLYRLGLRHQLGGADAQQTYGLSVPQLVK